MGKNAVLLCALFGAVTIFGCSSDEGMETDTSDTSEPGADASAGDVPDAMAALGTVGSPCESAMDCSDPPDAECFTDQGAQFGVVYPGGYCSKGCREEEGQPPVDCGTGMCVSTGASGGGGSVSQTYCAKPCETNDDCRVAEGYTCRQLPFNLGGYCGL